MLVLAILIVPPQEVAGEDFIEIVIQEGDYYTISLRDNSDEEIKYHIYVDESYNDQGIDIYIMETKELHGNYPDGDFSAPFMHINQRDDQGTYDIPNWGEWFFVFDNLDNSNEYDTVPDGDVKVYIYISTVDNGVINNGGIINGIDNKTGDDDKKSIDNDEEQFNFFESTWSILIIIVLIVIILIGVMLAYLWHVKQNREFYHSPPQPTQPLSCPTCNNRATYVQKYGKNYCYNCQKYLH
jgi:hypothetical protein